MRTLARIALILLAGQGLGRGAQAVYGVLLVRVLSPAGYGDFAYALAIAGTGVIVADLGFARLMVRDVARASDSATRAREMLKARAPGVLAVTVLCGIGAASGVTGVSPMLALASTVFLGAESFAYGYESAAVGSERPARFASVQLLSGVAVVLAGVAVVTAPSVSPAGAMACLAGTSLVKVSAHRVLWRGGRVRPLRALPVRTWTRDAAPFLALAVLAAVYYRAGIVVLHATVGPSRTAPFAAAMRIFDAAALVGGIGFSAVSPLISRIHRDRPDELWAVWKRLIGRAAVVVVPGAALAMAAAEPLAGAIFGAEYREPVGSLLAILLPGMAFAILQNLSAAVVFMSDDRRDVLRLTILNVSVLLTMIVVLTTTEGARGTAVAITVAEALSFLSFTALVRRRHRAPVSAPLAAETAR